jgi:hypothetical protein
VQRVSRGSSNRRKTIEVSSFLFSGGGPTADELFLLIRNKCSTKFKKSLKRNEKEKGWSVQVLFIGSTRSYSIEKWVRKKSKSFHLITPVQALVEVREIKVE